jgi:hypothetical protein
VKRSRFRSSDGVALSSTVIVPADEVEAEAETFARRGVLV